jgi:hypothetical protein
MRIGLIILALLFTLAASAQQESDSTLRRCPVFITDTVSSNNFFIEGQSCVLKVYRVKGDLTVEVRQKEQYLTFFFHSKRLKAGKYKIKIGAKSNDEVETRYSFRSGTQVSYVDVSSGNIEVTYDKDKKLWHMKVNGMLANIVERSVTYYKVRTDLFFP